MLRPKNSRSKKKIELQDKYSRPSRAAQKRLRRKRRGRGAVLVALLGSTAVVVYTIFSLQPKLIDNLIGDAKNFLQGNIPVAAGLAVEPTGVKGASIPLHSADVHALEGFVQGSVSATTSLAVESVGMGDAGLVPLAQGGGEQPLPPNDLPQAQVSAAEELQFVSIGFGFDSSELTHFSRTKLNKAIQHLLKFPSHVITIRGYSDGSGRKSYNLALSQRRAVTVAGYLIEGGVDASALDVEGRGDDSSLIELNDRPASAVLENEQLRVVRMEIHPSGESNIL